MDARTWGPSYALVGAAALVCNAAQGLPVSRPRKGILRKLTAKFCIHAHCLPPHLVGHQGAPGVAQVVDDCHPPPPGAAGAGRGQPEKSCVTPGMGTSMPASRGRVLRKDPATAPSCS